MNENNESRPAGQDNLQLHFDVDLDKLTWDDLIFVQEGGRSYRYAKEVCAKFMVNPDGESIPHEMAKRILGSLNEKEIPGVVQQVLKAIVEARKNAVNPTKDES